MDDIVERHDLRHTDGRMLRVYGRHDGRALPADAPSYEPAAIHQRYNALRDSWVAVSPARNQRPHAPSAAAESDACPLCPGGPEVPFDYEAAVFDNRFPSFVVSPPTPPQGPDLPGIGPLTAP
ncbi:MAG TPA: hypothetical protein VMM13_10135, partial [Euzebya sp.]|nr:hypothetical protein [Euzebya sp.]